MDLFPPLDQFSANGADARLSVMLGKMRVGATNRGNTGGLEIAPVHVPQVACHVQGELSPKAGVGAAGATAVAVERHHHVGASLVKLDRGKGHGFEELVGVVGVLPGDAVVKQPVSPGTQAT